MRRLASESQFLMFVFSRLDKLGARLSGVNASALPKLETVETAIERSGPGHPGFRRAVQLTDAIMKRVRARCRARIITFAIADSFYVDEFRKISERNGMEFLAGFRRKSRPVRHEAYARAPPTTSTGMKPGIGLSGGRSSSI